MALYGGVNIFGLAVKVRTVVNPRQAQKNSYPGLSGVEHLDLGLRGRYSLVEGLLFGSDAASLANAEILFQTYFDNIPRVFTDSYGINWANVVLESFEPADRIMRDSRGFYRKYSSRFFHLS